MTSQDKATSKFQKRINRLQKTIDVLTASVHRRREFARGANRFTKELLKEGRTTREELNKYFKPYPKK